MALEHTTDGLPSDIRTQIEQQRRRAGGGIGGKAGENSTSASARASAMGVTPTKESEEDTTSAEASDNSDSDKRLCQRCDTPAPKAWSYCATCGFDIVRTEDPGKKLGITFSDEDVEDYIFKGFVLREITILGTHKVLLKSSQPKDLKFIDDFLINGDYISKDKKVSDFFLKQLNSITLTASAIQKVDGGSIGKDLKDRVAWLEERGSALVDMLSQRVVWFNQALTRFLEEKNTLPGS